ncbi:MAG: single-stranded-DNA-specific exonuclease RecJ [Candidatus Cloacimonetes bacterium]|nr:single-stranded-DNA-specific exonuclease RecJ [Candidatus Cloacimonadota bacterium]
MEKRWKISEPLTEEEYKFKEQIVQHIHCPEIIAEILVKKGIINIERIKQFFEPSLQHTFDPFLFVDMDKAVRRIISAIETQQKITVYGDYDVDGATSTALLYLGFKRIGADIEYYIPNRMEEGYGLSLDGIQQIKERGTKLLISVDCGINADAEVETINSMDMDIIITDHHNPKDTLPNAFAIINAKVEDCGYPYKDLAGVGVAYKLLMAVYTRMNKNTPSEIERFLDLVAVGTIADIVPLTGENRIFASVGLAHLDKKRNIGLKALINIAGTSNKELNTTDIVFGLAPRINAAGRMGSAMRAVELLISKEEEESRGLAQLIEGENNKRQEIDQQTFREACELIEQKYPDMDNTYCFVISSENWHPGVIGIVASKLVERYYRPTIMISIKGGVGSGSGRSISDFDLFSALSELDDLLESFGGHKYAAGLSILPEYLEEFERRFQECTEKHIDHQQLIPPLSVDHKLELHHVNDKLISWLEKFAPYGPGNMRPVFYTDDVIVSSYPYTVGRNHLKLKIEKDGCVLDMIGFNLGQLKALLHKGDNINIAYSLEWNTWQNKTTIQGKIKDIHFVRS